MHNIIKTIQEFIHSLASFCVRVRLVVFHWVYPVKYVSRFHWAGIIIKKTTHRVSLFGAFMFVVSGHKNGGVGFLSTILVSSFLLLVFAFTHTTSAAPSYTMNYQGKLTTSANVAVPNGTYNMRFWLLTSPSVATTSALWTESLTGTNRVQVTNGLFSVMLGSTSPLTSVDFNQTLYLGVEVGSTTGSAVWDGEMSPRKILGTVPSAFVASTSLSTDKLDGLDSTQFVRTDATSSITTASADTLLTVTQNGAGDLLKLLSGTTNVFSVLNNGNVGVGSTSPVAKFSVAGNSYFGGNVTATGTVTFTNTTSGILVANSTGVLSASTTIGTSYLDSSVLLSSEVDTSAELAALLGDEVGTAGYVVFNASPTFTGTANFSSLTASASSTIGDGTGAGGLTINGNATTTGSLIVQGTATSTFANGIQLSNGCFRTADGNCLETAGDTAVVVAASDSPATEKAYADYVADGTNDEVQIQQAIDYVYANGGGGTVYLLAGIFTVGTTTYSDRSINMATSTRLVGQGNTTVIKLRDNHNTSIALIEAQNVSNVHVQNLALDGNDANNSAATYIAVKFFNSTSSTIEHSNLFGLDGYPITVNQSPNVRIQNNTFSNNVNNNIYVNHSLSSGLQVTNNYIDGGVYGIYTDGPDQFLIADNHILNVTSGVILIENSSSGLVTGNTIENDGSAIYISSGGDITVDSNNILNTDFGVQAWVPGNTISNNRFEGVRGTTVRIASENNSVVGNVFRSNGGGTTPAIFVDEFSADDTLISANNIYATGTAPLIRIDDSAQDRTVLVGNLFENPDTSTYVVDNGTNTRYNEWDRTTITTDDTRAYTIFGINASSSSSTTEIRNQGTGSILDLYNSSSRVLTVTNAGNVGIGTTTPAQKLSVAGGMHLTGGLYDSTYNAGTSGMVLQTTGSGVEWVATSTLGISSGSSFTDSAGLASILSDETGTGYAVFSNAPTFTGTTAFNALTVSATSTLGYASSSALTVSGNTYLSYASSTGISGTNLNFTNGYFTLSSSTNASTTGLTATNAYILNALGIGTSTPTAKFALTGTAGQTGSLFRLSSSTEAILFDVLADGSVDIGQGGIYYNASTDETTIANLNLGTTNFAPDSGAVSWVDMQSITTPINGVLSYTATLDGNAVFTVYGESDGSGGVQNLRVGIGSSTPSRTLTVAGDIFTANNLTVGSSTLGYASTTALTVSGNSYFNFASSSYASTTGLTLTKLFLGGNIYDSANATGTNGQYLMSTGTSTLWSTLSVAGDGVSNWLYNGSRLSPSTTVGIGIFASSTIGDGTGTGGLTVSGTATSTNLKVTSLTPARAIFTGADNLLTTSGTSQYLIDSLSDETGTGLAVFSNAPTFTGTTAFNALTVSATSTLGYASSSALTVSGNTYLSYASSTGISGTNLNFTNGYFTLSSSTNASTTGLTATNAYILNALGIGTSTPTAKFALTGTAGQTGSLFRLSSSTEAILFDVLADGSVDIGNGSLYYDAASQVTSISNLNISAVNFGVDAGVVSWVNMPAESLTIGSPLSYSARLDNNPVLTVYGESDGAGGVQNLRVGIGSSTPSRTLTVNGDIYSANIMATGTATTTNLFVAGAFYDTASTSGSNGQYLMSTGTSTRWSTISVSGDGVSNWSLVNGALAPTSSVGLLISASSTIGDGTGAGGLTVSGTATSTNLKVTSLTPARAIFTGADNLLTTSGTSQYLIDSLSDETGTGYAVFSASPTFTGGASFAGINVSASSTLGYASSTALSVAGNAYITSALGIGTTTPTAKFALTGTAGQTASLFRLSSSTEAILFDVLADGSVDIGQGGIYYNATTDETTIANLNIGASNFETDGGAVNWVDMQSSSTPVNGVLSYTATIDGNSVFTVYGESDGAGGVQNLRVGIGSTTPTSQLSVTGTARADYFNAASSSLLAGYYLNGLPAVIASTTLGNYYFANASSSTTTLGSLSNYAIGEYALANLTTGDYNFAVGYQALQGSSTAWMTGSYNNALGYSALLLNKSGSNNNAFGNNTLRNNNTGSDNNALGSNALNANTTGWGNNALGYEALNRNTTGLNNNAFGYVSLRENTIGSYNNGIGYSALNANTTGSYNSGVGSYSLYNNSTGSFNNAFGYNALRSNTYGSSSVAVGWNALYSNTTGASSTALGANAGYTNTIGNNNTYLGDESDSLTSALSNATAIGSHAKVGASNSLVLGGTGAWGVNVGIGTTSPWKTLSVIGDLSLSGGLFDTASTSGSNGQYLMSTGTSTRWSTIAVSGDGVSNWNLTSAGDALKPTSTKGIVISASSTIGDGTGAGGLTVSGTATSTNLKVTSLTPARAIFTGADNLLTTSGISQYLIDSLSDETGTGYAVFSNAPTFTGTAVFNALTVSATSTLGYASSTALSVAGNAYITSALGIGTSTPTANFALTGMAGQTSSLFRLSSSTESILFDVLADGSVDIGQGGIYYNATTDETTIANLNIGATSFGVDSGAVTWVNMDASSTPLGNVLSYTAKLDGNDVFTVYGESDGAGGVQNLRVGIGSTTPNATLSVTGSGTNDIFRFASSSNANILTLSGSGALALTGNFSASGLISTNALTVSASSTLGFASSTALTVSGNSYFNFASSSYASTTGLTLTNLYLGGALYDTANAVGTNGQYLMSTGTSTLWSTLSVSGDGVSNWNLVNGALAPTTTSGTKGIVVSASSTIGGGTGASGLTIYGGATTTLGAYFGSTVGIGTTSPSARLSVVGTAGSQNIFNFASSTGSTLLALNARGVLTFGTTTGLLDGANIFLNGGPTSTPINSNIYNNIAIGNEAFSYVSTSGSFNNIALGNKALYGSSSVPMTGGQNFAAGSQALTNNTSGGYNTAIGNWALRDNTEGSFNTAIGDSALLLNISGEHNNAMGNGALGHSLTGSYNNAFGNYVLEGNTSGSYNNAMGASNTLRSNTTGSHNNAFGMDALGSNTTGSSNIAIGGATQFDSNGALYSNTTGSYNIGIGFSAGRSMTTGTSTLFLGARTNTLNGSISSSTAIGAGALLARSNTMVLGGTGANSVDIVTGTSTPFAKFSIQNNFGSTTALFDIATTTSSSYATSSLFKVGYDGRVSIGSSTPESLLLTLNKAGITGAGVYGIKEYLGFVNSTQSAVYYGDNAYIVNAPTATSTMVAKMLRIEDSTNLGNTVRGIEVQAQKGTNTKGENTAISGYGRTFGVRGTTEGDAGDTYLPAGVYAETRGTTQGNALRAYSGTITTSNLAYLFQDSSVFSGTGLLMNFGNAGGSFAATSSAKFIDLQVGGTSKFYVAANGSTTIGDGSVNASLRIPRGGICVDNDGSCISTTTGEIRSVTSALGNSDLAEMYFSGETLKTGEIVSLIGGLSMGRASKENTENILGVVSTKPGMTLGFDDTSLVPGEQGYPVGLKGRVPVQLSTENGPIAKGDRITISSVPGVGMKATESSTVVGIALEDYNGETAYSAGFLNQFGDDLVKERITLKRNADPRTDNGCYEGGGVALGETPCTPDKVKALKPLVISIDERTETLRTLSREEATTTTLKNGEEVHIGQAIMFIELTHYTIPSESEILAELNSTTTLLNGNGTETMFDRLKALANAFVDGVLTLAEVVADKFTAEEVNTSMLCIGETCVDEATLKALLQAQGQGPVTPVDPTPEPEPQPPVEDPGSGGTDENPPADGGTEPAPPVVEETPAPEVTPIPEVTPEPQPEPEPASVAEAAPSGEPSI